MLLCSLCQAGSGPVWPIAAAVVAIICAKP